MTFLLLSFWLFDLSTQFSSFRLVWLLSGPNEYLRVLNFLVVMKSRSVFIAHLVSWFYVWVWVLQGWCRGEHQNSILLPIFKYSMGEQGWNICLLIWSTRRTFFLYHCRRTVLSIYKKYPGIPNMVWFDVLIIFLGLYPLASRCS